MAEKSEDLRARASPALVDKLDAWRTEYGFSRAEAIRTLLARALEHPDRLDRLEDHHDAHREQLDEIEQLLEAQLGRTDRPDRADVDELDELEDLPLAHVEPVDP